METGTFLGLREYLWLCKLVGGALLVVPKVDDGFEHKEAVLCVDVALALATCVEDKSADVAALLEGKWGGETEPNSWFTGMWLPTLAD